MSNVIKSSCVLYDRAPIAISLQSDGGVCSQPSAGDVGQMLSNNAIESADISLKLAVAKVEEVSSRSKIEVQLNFLSAVKEGRLKGHEDGLSKGRSDGSVRAAENVSAAAQEFIAHMCDLNNQYSERISEAKADCIDFAFSLAEDILGMRIDRESDTYAELLDSFLAKKKSKATLEADGRSYQFETYMPDALISSADGLQGISVSVETEKIEQTAECHQENECESIDAKGAADEQIDANLQAAVIEQQAAVAQSFETKIEADNVQIEQNEILTNQPQAKAAVSPQISDEICKPDDAVEPEADNNSVHVQSTLKASDSPDKNGIEDEAAATQAQENIIDSEKFVFVRPAKKSITKKAGQDNSISHEVSFEDIARIGQDNLKALSRKAAVNDIAAALSGASEAVSTALMNSMTRRTKENVLDVMKYLGPMSQADIDAARNKLVKLSAEIIGTHERDEPDV